MANIGYIQVNRYCNNKCHFCSNPSNGKNITYKKGINDIDTFIEKGYSGIIFTGGEPTLSSDLINWIKYTCDKGIDARIISNGMKCANFDYMKNLKNAGLSLIHFSVYSHNSKIHDFLTDTPGSWLNVIKAIQNALSLGIRVQINTVINHYNENHLDKIIIFLIKYFPQIKHFVWNNLDPLMMRKTKIALSTLPNFDIFSISLKKAMKLLEENSKTFRAERVPLCFMRGFEFASTETRKLVKNEKRRVHFLDARDIIEQISDDFFHDKLNNCKKCDLNSICAGVYDSKIHYNYVHVYSQKLSLKEKNEIINKILKKYV